MQSRSTFGSRCSLIGAICALAGLASAGIAQGQASPPAGQGRPPQAAAPVIAAPLPSATESAKPKALSDATALDLAILAMSNQAQANPVVKMSAGQWLYHGDTKLTVPLWVSSFSPRFQGRPSRVKP